MSYLVPSEFVTKMVDAGESKIAKAVLAMISTLFATFTADSRETAQCQ